MAEENDQEKTEQPSPRRLEQAREEGQVPQSRELSTFMVLISGTLALWAFGGWAGGRIMPMLRQGWSFERPYAFDTALMLQNFGSLFSQALITMLPLFAVVMVASVAGPILLGGLVFSPKVLRLKPDRLNPLNGLKRMFSMNSLAELLKSLLKTSIIFSMAVFAVMREKEHVFTLMLGTIDTAIPDFFNSVIFAALLIVLGLAIIAMLDVPYQLWQYQRKLRMSKEEVKREYKEQEGDPHLKARVRSIQRDMARKRMMSNVPKADVVVTNPTHFAVALKYDAHKMNAPVVLAKGRGEIALKIRELAKDHHVPLLEAPPLARALYRHCELEQAIPAALYTAVAEVMAYIYQLNEWMKHGGKQKPAVPTSLPVPPGMDPGPGTAA